MIRYPLEGQSGTTGAPSDQGALSAEMVEEISPAMIEAGVAACEYLEAEGVSTAFLVREVFLAMAAARTANSDCPKRSAS
jgi:hypothetical protein